MLKNLYKSTLRAISGKTALPIQIDITNACNLRCSHCYHSHHRNNGALTFEDWKKVIRDYKELLDKLLLDPQISICGGEPTISPFFKDMVFYLFSEFPDLQLNVLTNGTFISRKLLEDLKGKNITFQVSLDGPDSKTHDLIRGKGSFEKSLSGIKLLREFKFTVSILSVLSKNSSEKIEEFFGLARDINVHAMNFTRLIPQGNGKSYVESGRDRSLTGLDLKAAMENIIFYSKKHNVKTNTNQPLYNLLDEKLGMHSKMGFQGFVISYKGDLKPSSRSNYSVGNVLEESLSDLYLKNPLMKSLRSGSFLGCKDCSHNRRCGGDRNFSFAVYGDFLSPDIGCWKYNFKTIKKGVGYEAS
ncbi:MAG: radical SAM protein [Bdellovibrionales bacterium]|nr:radical SAM protein [Bdellovibrionales bacterium]